MTEYKAAKKRFKDSPDSTYNTFNGEISEIKTKNKSINIKKLTCKTD